MSVESKLEEPWFLLPGESPEPSTTDPLLQVGTFQMKWRDGMRENRASPRLENLGIVLVSKLGRLNDCSRDEEHGKALTHYTRYIVRAKITFADARKYLHAFLAASALTMFAKRPGICPNRNPENFPRKWERKSVRVFQSAWRKKRERERENEREIVESRDSSLRQGDPRSLRRSSFGESERTNTFKTIWLPAPRRGCPSIFHSSRRTSKCTCNLNYLISRNNTRPPRGERVEELKDLGEKKRKKGEERRKILDKMGTHFRRKFFG